MSRRKVEPSRTDTAIAFRFLSGDRPEALAFDYGMPLCDIEDALRCALELRKARLRRASGGGR